MSDYDKVSRRWRTLGVAALTGGATLMGLNIYQDIYDKRIPKEKQVQQGYVAPSRLEVELEDLDGNGEPETIMRIDDKPYLLREVNGEPILSAYEIRPAEIVPKE